MSNSRAKKIREYRDALDKRDNDYRRAVIQNQCACPHNIDGDPGRCLKPVTKNGKQIILKCDLCGKEITLTPPKAVEFKAAAATIENGIDYIKMSLLDTNSKEDKLLNDCAEALVLLNKINKVYDNLDAMGGRSKKRKDGEHRRTAYAITNRSILD